MFSIVRRRSLSIVARLFSMKRSAAGSDQRVVRSALHKSSSLAMALAIASLAATSSTSALVAQQPIAQGAPDLLQGTRPDYRGPMPVPLPPQIESPKDIPYPGISLIHVDATDVKHRRYRIQESIPVHSGPLTLLYPQWTPGDHSPDGPLEKLAGLVIRDRGKRLSWIRDPVSVYAFHVEVPAGANALDVKYDYLGSGGPTTGPVLISETMLDLQWTSAVLYPAGYFSRDIRFEPSITVPRDWEVFSSLEGAKRSGDTVSFDSTDLETLVDSPVMSGRYAKQVVLAARPHLVTLDVAADDPAGLARLPEAAEQMIRLQAETIALFGTRPYRHYDHMLWLGKGFGQVYFEHHQSGENSRGSSFLKAGNGPAPDLSFIEHGYIHAWNGMSRRPAAMWTPNLNTPEQDGMLWVFEGLTEYWSDVVAVRAGLAKSEDAQSSFATMAAYTSIAEGAKWRTLADVSNGPVFAFRKTVEWPSWQRDMFEAYSQGELIWLGVDTLLRDQTKGRRSLDDLARTFFHVSDGDRQTYTYSFDDLVAALNTISPYDWGGYLSQRLQEHGTALSLTGIRGAGYRLGYTDKPASAESANSFLDFAFSLGMQVGSGGRIVAVHWDGPAFEAGLTPGGVITSVNGNPYDALQLQASVALGGTIELRVEAGGLANTYLVRWTGGLRQPALTRESDRPDLFAAIFLPRAAGIAND